MARITGTKKLPANVDTILCIMCEERVGKQHTISDGDVEFPMRLCGQCKKKIDAMPELDRDTAKMILDRLIDRGIIDAYDWDWDK